MFIKKNNIVLSIIIPVFNVERYIEKCIESICEVKSEKIEIIIVDDGSTDKSLEICKRKQLLDKRIQVIHISNSGASSARNTGIKYANGKYIFFCDSDDFINNCEFEKLEKILEEQTIDIFIFDKCYEGQKNDEYNLDKIGLKYGYTDDLNDIYKYVYSIRLSAPWKKIFRTSIIVENHIEFPAERILHEDLSFFLKYLKYVKNAFVLENSAYYHRYTTNSLSSKAKERMFYDIRETFFEMEKLSECKKIPDEFLNLAKNRYLAILMGIIVKMKKNDISTKQIKRYLKDSNVGKVFDNIKILDVKCVIRYIFYKLGLISLYYFIYEKGRM